MQGNEEIADVPHFSGNSRLPPGNIVPNGELPQFGGGEEAIVEAPGLLMTLRRC